LNGHSEIVIDFTKSQFWHPILYLLQRTKTDAIEMVVEYLEAVTDHIFLIQGEKQGRFPRGHAVLIDHSEAALVDTGCGIPRLQTLKRDYKVNTVINSHTHPDHSAGNWVFQGLPIFVPEEAFTTAGNLVGLSHRFVNDELASIWRNFAQSEMGFQNCPPTQYYNEDTTFCIDDVVLTPIYTPGHTIDHYCFYFPAKRVLFTFDYDLTSFPWYGHEESNLADFRQSIAKLQALPTDVIVSSHRGIISDNIQSEWEMYVNRLNERSQRILALLDSPQTLDQLVQFAPIYKKFPYQEQLLRYWEGIMIHQHLLELKEAGKINVQGSKYVRNKK
jgi:glyoxylase-like metal-dependent hydrolase (beta-lactamase superfamily II)